MKPSFDPHVLNPLYRPHISHTYKYKLGVDSTNIPCLFPHSCRQNLILDARVSMIEAKVKRFPKSDIVVSYGSLYAATPRHVRVTVSAGRPVLTALLMFNDDSISHAHCNAAHARSRLTLCPAHRLCLLSGSSPPLRKILGRSQPNSNFQVGSS
jgi:hypothetical protein